MSEERILPSVDEAECLPLVVFAGLDLVLRVDSTVLGEPVLFVGDAYQPAPGDPIAYRARELAALIGVDPAAVRLAHAAKRAFPGARVTTTAWAAEDGALPAVEPAEGARRPGLRVRAPRRDPAEGA